MSDDPWRALSDDRWRDMNRLHRRQHEAAEQRLLKVETERDAARLVLRAHQWGGSGHCPECAFPMSGEVHRSDCRWAAAMGDVWGALVASAIKTDGEP